jgi:hypothetical protein
MAQILSRLKSETLSQRPSRIFLALLFPALNFFLSRAPIQVKISQYFLATPNFSGTIPTQLGLLSNLTSLYIAQAAVTGTLPTEIGRLTKLNILSIVGTKVTGTIPTEYSRLTNLTFLALQQNKLDGTIPDFSPLPGLGYVTLGSNQLRGTIPKEIEETIMLEFTPIEQELYFQAKGTST